MKTLFLTNYLPFPADTGTKMRSLNFLKVLAGKGQVTLICPKGPADESHAPGLAGLCEKVVLVDSKTFGPYPRTAPTVEKWKTLLEPWALRDFISEDFRRELMKLEPASYDLIFIRYPQLAYYFLTRAELKGLLPKVVIDVDDIGILMQERRVNDMAFGYRKLRHWLDLQFLKNYYRKMRQARACFITNAKDRDFLLREGYAKKVFVMPNTIEVNGRNDEIRMTNVETNPNTQKKSNGSKLGLSGFGFLSSFGIRHSDFEILFCGTLSFPHNTEGLFYFCDQVFPEIRRSLPDAILTVIGKNPTPEVLALNKRPGILVIGPVPSTRPYYDKAALTVVPLLNGAGTRIKILESMAYGKPVVATSVGAEGIDAENGKHLLIADKPADFAKACVAMLSDETMRNRIASDAYALVKEKYDTRVFEKKMEEFLYFFDQKSECRNPNVEANPNSQKNANISKLGHSELGIPSSFGIRHSGFPKVSVIIPTYNRPDYLAKAIESVMAQTYQDWELIVVDDGCPGNIVAKVAQEYCEKDSRIRYVRQSNRGVSHARNTGAEAAKGRYVAFLDDDDQWYPDKLQKQVAFMESHPEIGLCYARFETIRVMDGNQVNSKMLPEGLPTDFKGILCGDWTATSTYLILKNRYLEVNGFDERYPVAQDYDLMLRFTQRWKIGAIADALAFTFKDDHEKSSKDGVKSASDGIAVLQNLQLTPDYAHYRSVVRRHRARIQYLRGGAFYERGKYFAAAKDFLQAIAAFPLVGSFFRRSDECGLKFMTRIAKAYMAVPYCLFKGLIHGGR